MSKKKSSDLFESNPDTLDEPDHDEGVEVAGPSPKPHDPNEPQEYTVLTDGAVFKHDQFVSKAADVPKPKTDDSADTTVCHIGDVVKLTPDEAAAKRASGVALGGPIPQEVSA